MRVIRQRGPAHRHRCVECGKRGTGRGMHWSLRPGTKHLQTDPKGLHYSTDPAAYEPRCSYCHVWRDKYLRTGRGPVLVEIAGLILQAVEEAAGGSPPARSTGSPRRTASTSGR